jgi:hypothetical protein
MSRPQWKTAYRMARMNALGTLFSTHRKPFAFAVIECAAWRRIEPMMPASRFKAWGGYARGNRLHLGPFMERGAA